jgi:hypothetical protein
MTDAKPPRFRFPLSRLLAWHLLAALVIGGVSLLVMSLHGARIASKMTDCRCMKEIIVYLSMYVTRYGNDRDYPPPTPPTVPPPAPVTIAAGPNGGFWSHFWCTPSAQNSVLYRERAMAGGHNFRCPVYGSRSTPTVMDYSGPNFADPAFPGGILSDRVKGNAFIYGDLCLPGDENHGRGVEFNALSFDGTSRRIQPRSPDETQYYAQTNAYSGGVRSR